MKVPCVSLYVINVASRKWTVTDGPHVLLSTGAVPAGARTLVQPWLQVQNNLSAHSASRPE